MPDQTTGPAGPRLGAALIIGADAAICVHVHTGPAGIAAISARLHELDTTPGRAPTVPVVAVTGVPTQGVGPTLVLTPAAWARMLDTVREGERRG
jgi:hypothetical protein